MQVMSRGQWKALRAAGRSGCTCMQACLSASKRAIVSGLSLADLVDAYPLQREEKARQESSIPKFKATPAPSVATGGPASASKTSPKRSSAAQTVGRYPLPPGFVCTWLHAPLVPS